MLVITMLISSTYYWRGKFCSFRTCLLKFDDNAHQDHDYEISRELKQIQKNPAVIFMHIKIHSVIMN